MRSRIGRAPAPVVCLLLVLCLGALPLHAQSLRERLKSGIRSQRDSVARAAEALAKSVREAGRTGTSPAPAVGAPGKAIQGPTIQIKATAPEFRSLSLASVDGVPRIGQQETLVRLPISPEDPLVPNRGGDLVAYWTLLLLSLEPQRFATVDVSRAPGAGSVSATLSSYASRLLARPAAERLLCHAGNCERLRGALALEEQRSSDVSMPLWASGGSAADVKRAEQEFVSEVLPKLLTFAKTVPTSVAYVHVENLSPYDAAKGGFAIPMSRVAMGSQILVPIPRRLGGSFGALTLKGMVARPLRPGTTPVVGGSQLRCVRGREEPACPVWKVSPAEGRRIEQAAGEMRPKVYLVSRIRIVAPDDLRQAVDGLEYVSESPTFRVYSDSLLTQLIGEYSYETGAGTARSVSDDAAALRAASVFRPRGTGPGVGEWVTEGSAQLENALSHIRIDRADGRVRVFIGRYGTGRERRMRVPEGVWAQTYEIDCDLAANSCVTLIGPSGADPSARTTHKSASVTVSPTGFHVIGPDDFRFEFSQDNSTLTVVRMGSPIPYTRYVAP